MTPPHRAVLRFDYANIEQARQTARSLRPELDAIDGDRTTATLSREGQSLRLTVVAEDLVALRAGCNTWLTLTDVADSAGCAVSGNSTDSI